MSPPSYGGITEEEELGHTFHEVDIFKDETVSYDAGVLKMHDTDGRVVASTQGTMVWRAGQWVMSPSAAASASASKGNPLSGAGGRAADICRPYLTPNDFKEIKQSVQVRPLHFSWPIFMLSSPLMFLSLVLYPAALVLGSLLFTFQSVCFYLTGSVCSDLQPQFCFQLPVEVYRGCYGLTNQLDRFSNSVDLEDNQKAPLLGSKSNVPGLITGPGFYRPESV